MIRLFVALKIPNEVKDKIFSHLENVVNLADFQWEPKEKIHLTLKFIGNVREELLPKIIQEIEFVKEYSSFDCEVSNLGFFFRYNEAKILWCNLFTDKTILSLVDELNERLEKFDIAIEKRKFKGHLTLLRIKKRVDQDFIKKFEEFKLDPIKFNGNQVVLIQSFLKPGGSEYKVLKNYELINGG
jgi:RNA 2',3'-cyclic 3'-phosphodiesterase